MSDLAYCPSCGVSYTLENTTEDNWIQCTCDSVLYVAGIQSIRAEQFSCYHCSSPYQLDPGFFGQKLGCTCGVKFFITKSEPGAAVPVAYESEESAAYAQTAENSSIEPSQVKAAGRQFSSTRKNTTSSRQRSQPLKKQKNIFLPVFIVGLSLHH